MSQGTLWITCRHIGTMLTILVLYKSVSFIPSPVSIGIPNFFPFKKRDMLCIQLLFMNMCLRLGGFCIDCFY